MKVTLFSRQEWLEYFGNDAHFSVFKESVGDTLNKSFFDAAAVVFDNTLPVIYTTVKQLSEDSVYLEFGGSFPEYRGSFKVLKAFKLLIETFKNSGALMVGFATKNDNVAMQKLGLGAGFLPCGFHTTKSGVFIEYTLNFKEGE